MTTPTQAARDAAQIDVDALAEELTSAANIVTNDGYYEIDVDAVAQQLAQAFARFEAQVTAAKDAEIERLREALRKIDTALDEYFENSALSAAEDDCIAAIVSAMMHPNARATLTDNMEG